MVKSAKLWREISLQYAKLQEDGDCGHSWPPVAPSPSANLQAQGDKTVFYKDGWQSKHWVLVCCAMMVACEWVDRSVLSIAMQSMKEEFHLSDTQVGIMASASLWIVPFATGPIGRLADYVPRARLLGVGITGWGTCTFFTGSSSSFHLVLLWRLLAGLANCAGYPVAVSLLADHFQASELTTAMGYYNAGMSMGGLLGYAVGGILITSCGWRWAFYVVAIPQLFIALLFFTTVPEGRHSKPVHSWGKDLRQLLGLKALVCMTFGSFLTGVTSGQGRFLSAFIQRRHGVAPARIGLVMGPVVGVTGILSSWGGGHAVDRCLRRTGDHRSLLRLAALADLLGIALGAAAIVAPSFGVLVFCATLNVAVGSMRQGEQTIIAELATGRRGTAQGFLETCWAVGMGLGPFAAGAVSDTMSSVGGDCDESCALARSLLLFVSVGMGGRAVISLCAASYFYGDMDRIKAEQGPTEEPAVPSLPPPMLPPPEEEETVAASGVAAGPVASVLGRSGEPSSDGRAVDG